MERRELLDGKKLYYEIEIPVQELSVCVPGQAMQDMGVRPAMSRSRLPRVLARLQGCILQVVARVALRSP